MRGGGAARLARMAGVVAGACVALCARALLAWGSIANPPITWETIPAKYWLNVNGCADVGGFDATVPAVEGGFDAWENNDCTSFQVAFQGSTSLWPFDMSDDHEVFGWYESRWPYGSSAIAITEWTSYRGHIASSDIGFNGVHYTWSLTGGSGKTDIQSLAAHEEGHFLGLDDLYDCAGDPETMCGYYSGGTDSRTLTADDREGVCTLYPGTGPPPACTTSDQCEPKYECVDGECIGRICAVCLDHEDCGDADDYCIAGFADGKMYCGASCAADPECGPGNKCLEMFGGVTQCVPVNLDCSGTAPPPTCLVDGDCAPGHVCRDGSCVVAPPPPCAADTDCPPGYVCEPPLCVPDTSAHLPVCSPCAADEQCGWEQDACVSAFPDGAPFSDGRSYCGVACSTVGGDCGPGYACWVFADKPAQCLPEGKECTSCDPQTMSGCAAGLYCDATGCAAGVCRPGAAGAKEPGEPCAADTDCQTLQCVRQGRGSFCSAACSTFGPERCPGPSSCEPLEYNACGYCSCAAGRLGDACTAGEDCQSGGCFALPDRSARVCSMYCGGAGIACPDDFACETSSDGLLGCFPKLLRPGQTCIDESAQCLGGWCDVEEGICTRSCDGSCACPSDMTCATAADGARVCAKGGVLTSGCSGCVVAPRDGAPGAAGLALLVLAAAAAVIAAARAAKRRPAGRRGEPSRR